MAAAKKKKAIRKKILLKVEEITSKQKADGTKKTYVLKPPKTEKIKAEDFKLVMKTSKDLPGIFGQMMRGDEFTFTLTKGNQQSQLK